MSNKFYTVIKMQNSVETYGEQYSTSSLTEKSELTSIADLT